MKCFVLLLFTASFVVSERLSSSEIFDELVQKYRLHLPEKDGDFDEPEKAVRYRQRQDDVDDDFDDKIKVNTKQQRQQNNNNNNNNFDDRLKKLKINNQRQQNVDVPIIRFQNQQRDEDFNQPRRQNFRLNNNQPVIEAPPRQQFRPRPPVNNNKEFNLPRQVNRQPIKQFDNPQNNRQVFRETQSNQKIVDDRPNLPPAQSQPVRQVPPAPVPAIIKQINEMNEDGSYTFGYESEDGTYRVETRGLDGITRGKYGYLDAGGVLKEVEYSAGGGIGYKPSGDEIDVPPPYKPDPRRRDDEEEEERVKQVEQRSRTTRPRPSGRFEAEEEDLQLQQHFLNDGSNRNHQQQQQRPRIQEKPRGQQRGRFRNEDDEIFSLSVDYEK